jgi:hypothetical protein
MSELRIEDRIAIQASKVQIWLALEAPAVHARWHPSVTEIAGEHRLGEVRTCSVLIGGKRGQTEERCVVEQQSSRIAWSVEEDSSGFGRFVSNWRAGFSLTERDDAATVVTAESTFEPNNLLVRAMLPIIRRKFHQTQRAILAAPKQSLETHADAVHPGVRRS